MRIDEFTNKYIRIKMLKGYKTRVIGCVCVCVCVCVCERERERRRDLKKKLIV